MKALIKFIPVGHRAVFQQTFSPEEQECIITAIIRAAQQKQREKIATQLEDAIEAYRDDIKHYRADDDTLCEDHPVIKTLEAEVKAIRREAGPC